MMRRALLVSVALLSLAMQGSTGRRKPLTAMQTTRIDHEPTAVRQRYDTSMKRFVTYSPDGRIGYRARSRDFLLDWTGPDGRRDSMTVELGDRVSAVVAASVTYDASTRLYTYDYTISNVGPDSQRLQTVYLEGGGITDARMPTSQWYSRSLTPYLTGQLRLHGGWAFSEVSSAGGIRLGHAVSGFRVRSTRPPTVVRVYVAGRRKTPSARSDLPEELHAALDAVAFKLPAGVTVGPDPEPEPRNNEEMLQRLERDLRLAEGAGWMAPAPISKSAERIGQRLGGLGEKRTAVGAIRRNRASIPSQDFIWDDERSVRVGYSAARFTKKRPGETNIRAPPSTPRAGEEHAASLRRSTPGFAGKYSGDGLGAPSSRNPHVCLGSGVERIAESVHNALSQPSAC